MPPQYYQLVRRRCIFAVSALLALMAGLSLWDAAREQQLVISAGAFAAVLSFLILGGAIPFLRQVRNLEATSRKLEDQQTDLAVKNEEIMAAVKEWRSSINGLKKAELQAANFAAIALERSRNEAERAELEIRLGQSQKMEAIGQLAGGVAHDFNNLLTPIIVYADLLKRALANEETLLPKIDGIIKASHKARDLTQQLLSFGRKQVLQMQNVDLNEVVSAVHSTIRRTLRENIDVRMQLSTHPGIIRVDRFKIDQIILNLAINAQDAIAETGQVTLETSQIVIDDEYARRHPGMQTGRYVLLAFKDNGCGMSDEIMPHIFEPFFTTKQVGHGTGLGLANVYGTVKQHKGYITVQSEVGVGTTFSMYFPLVDGTQNIIGQDAAHSLKRT